VSLAPGCVPLGILSLLLVPSMFATYLSPPRMASMAEIDIYE